LPKWHLASPHQRRITPLLLEWVDMTVIMGSEARHRTMHRISMQGRWTWHAWDPSVKFTDVVFSFLSSPLLLFSLSLSSRPSSLFLEILTSSDTSTPSQKMSRAFQLPYQIKKNQTNPDYTRLQNDSISAALSSAYTLPSLGSPLRYTGDLDTPGFANRYAPLADLTPESYMARYSHLTGNSWLRESTMQRPLVDHLIDLPHPSTVIVRDYDHDSHDLHDFNDFYGQEPLALLPPPLPPLPPVSQWISTTADADWAIWNIARQLAFGPRTGNSLLQLASVRLEYHEAHQGRDEAKRQLVDEAWIDPVRVLSDLAAAGGQAGGWRGGIESDN